MLASRLKLLFRMVKYYYSINPLLASLTELSKIVSALILITNIFVTGMFLDGTVEILTDWEVFDLKAYFVTDSFHYLIVWLILWCFMSILGKIVLYFEVILEGDFYYKADLDILRKISTTNLQEIEERQFQDLINYVPDYSTTRFVETYNSLSLAFIHFIKVLSSIGMLYMVLGWSAFLIILLVLPENLIQFIRNNNIREYVDNSIGKIKFMNYIRLISTRVPDFPEMRVSGVFKHLKRIFKKKADDYYSGFYDKHFHLYSDKAFFSVLDQIFLTCYIIYILAVSVAKGVTIGQFSALVNYARTGYHSAYLCFSNIFNVFNDLLYVKSFFDLLDYKGFGDIPEGYEKLSKVCPTLEFKNLTFVYPKTKEKVLGNVSFKIEPGQKVAFVGSSGSGKSSLVRILCGLFKVPAGQYLIGSHPIEDLARGELKNVISVIFQDFVRYNFSLKRNITIGSRSLKINVKLYEEVKRIALVKEFMRRLKINDSQFLGKFFGLGKELSPGYWQKLAIARMLYRDKDIMIMDEPFTFIDGYSKSKILKRIIEFVGDKRILIYITQDTDHLENFDKIYYFKRGVIVEKGTYKELMKRKGAFYKEASYNR